MEERRAAQDKAFESALAEAASWISGYRAELESYPVLSQVAPGQVLSQLPAAAPTKAEPFAAILEDVDKIILPGITHWQHPKSFGYFPANSSPPSVLAELLIATLGVQGMSWATSPAATELEIRINGFSPTSTVPHFSCGTYRR